MLWIVSLVPIRKQEVVVVAGGGDFADSVAAWVRHRKTEKFSIRRPAKPVRGHAWIANGEERLVARAIATDPTQFVRPGKYKVAV